MTITAPTRTTLRTRLSGRRFSSRGRRLRTLAAAGSAGVSMSLLAAGSGPSAVGPPARFAAALQVSGLVAVPVRFADAGSVGYLRPGDRIDVLAASDSPAAPRSGPPGAGPPSGSEPETAAAVDVSVLEIAHDAGAGALSRASSGDGGLVFLAVDNPTAARLARAAASGRLSFALHRP